MTKDEWKTKLFILGFQREKHDIGLYQLKGISVFLFKHSLSMYTENTGTHHSAVSYPESDQFYERILEELQ